MEFLGSTIAKAHKRSLLPVAMATETAVVAQQRTDARHQQEPQKVQRTIWEEGQVVTEQGFQGVDRKETSIDEGIWGLQVRFLNFFIASAHL